MRSNPWHGFSISSTSWDISTVCVSRVSEIGLVQGEPVAKNFENSQKFNEITVYSRRAGCALRVNLRRTLNGQWANHNRTMGEPWLRPMLACSSLCANMHRTHGESRVCSVAELSCQSSLTLANQMPAWNERIMYPGSIITVVNIIMFLYNVVGGSSGGSRNSRRGEGAHAKLFAFVQLRKFLKFRLKIVWFGAYKYSLQQFFRHESIDVYALRFE